MNDIILYKLADKKESTSQTVKNKVFNSMPDKEGYIRVYMPYGLEGKGFYYKKQLKMEE